MNKKIELIQPTSYDDRGKVIKKGRLYFVGLAYPILAALTPKDWDVRITLETIEDIPFDTDADVIGIGGMGQAANRGKDIAQEFKRRGKTVIMGGPMVSLAPELARPFCDSIVIGDAEDVWQDILTDLERGTLKPLYKRQLEKLAPPVPKYELILEKKIGDFLPVQAGRGCSNTCGFCSIYCLYRGRYLKRTIPDVIRDVEKVRSLGFKKFLLLDDNIVSDRDYMLALCRELKTFRMQWMSQCTINVGKDDELLGALSESGCNLLSFGLESINRDSLRELNKAWANPDEYRDLIEHITSYGIDVASEMIVGADSDTKESLRQTVDFVKSTRIMAPKFYIMTPVPGTDLFKDLSAKGRIIEGTDLFTITASTPVITHPNMTTAELKDIFWEIYDRLYSFPAILKRTVFQKHFLRDPGRYLFYLLVNIFYRFQIKRRIGPIIM